MGIDLDSVQLSDEEIKKNIRLAKENDVDARNKIIEQFYKMSYKIARRYIGGNFEVDELANVGILAIVDAIKSYDEEKGSFSTLAYRCIYTKIYEYVNRFDQAISKPYSYSAEMKKIEKRKYALAVGSNEMTSVDKLAEDLGYTDDQLQKKMDYKKRFLSLDKLMEINSSASNNGDEKIIDKVIDDIYHEQLRQQLLEIIDSCNLTSKEKQYLVVRYFSKDGYKKLKETFTELGLKKPTKQKEENIIGKIIISSDGIRDLLADLYVGCNEYVDGEYAKKLLLERKAEYYNRRIELSGRRKCKTNAK